MAPRSTLARRLGAALALAIGTVALAVPAPASATTSAISLTSDSPSVVAWTNSRVQGTVSPAGLTSAVVLQKQVGDGWVDIATVKPDEGTGAYEALIFPHDAGALVLRARSAGGSVVSPELTLQVAHHPTVISATVSPSEVVRTDTTLVYGRVIEPTATPYVVLERLVGGKWLDRSTATVDQRTGRFILRVTPQQAGTYTLRVRSARGTRVSPRLLLTVHELVHTAPMA